MKVKFKKMSELQRRLHNAAIVLDCDGDEQLVFRYLRPVTSSCVCRWTLLYCNHKAPKVIQWPGFDTRMISRCLLFQETSKTYQSG